MILENARTATRALRVNKLRSALTMLGIIIGVGAIIAVVAVGAGAHARVAEQIQNLGSNLLIVLSNSVNARGVRGGGGSGSTLTEDDAYAIQREIPAVQAAAPTLGSSKQLCRRDRHRVRFLSRPQGRTPRSHRGSAVRGGGHVVAPTYMVGLLNSPPLRGALLVRVVAFG